MRPSIYPRLYSGSRYAELITTCMAVFNLLKTTHALRKDVLLPQGQHGTGSKVQQMRLCKSIPQFLGVRSRCGCNAFHQLR